MNRVEQTKVFLKELTEKIEEIIKIKWPSFASDSFSINYDSSENELTAVIDKYIGCGDYETYHLEIDIHDLEKDEATIREEHERLEKERLEKKKQLKEKLMQAEKAKKEAKEKAEYERLKKKFEK